MLERGKRRRVETEAAELVYVFKGKERMRGGEMKGGEKCSEGIERLKGIRRMNKKNE